MDPVIGTEKQRPVYVGEILKSGVARAGSDILDHRSTSGSPIALPQFQPVGSVVAGEVRDTSGLKNGAGDGRANDSGINVGHELRRQRQEIPSLQWLEKQRHKAARAALTPLAHFPPTRC